MLDDRDYMRINRQNQRINYGCLFPFGATTTILFITIITFIFQVANPEVTDRFSLVSPLVFQKAQFYRLFSYVFLHGNFSHLFFNMWGLYMFGSLLEDRIGTAKFYTLYLISGVSGALFWLIFNAYSPVYCVGASGAIFGIIIATALFYPNMQIFLIFPPIPMKLKTFAIAYALIEIIFEFSQADSRIAHIVHLGGFLGGYVYIKAMYGNRVWGFSSIFKSKPKHKLYDKNEFIFSSEESHVSQEELDRLLDKISTDGINSLTEEEMETLRRAREELNKYR